MKIGAQSSPLVAFLIAALLLLTGCTQFTYTSPSAESSPQGEPASTQPDTSSGSRPDEMLKEEDNSDWIVDAEQAVALIEEGEEATLVWDARHSVQGRGWPGVEQVTWQEFSRQDAPYAGLLLDDLEALKARLKARGVRDSKRVVVLDDPLNGWGEGGRLVWMLRALGHERAHLVLAHQGVVAELERALDALPPRASEEQGALTLDVNEEVRVDLERVRELLDEPDVVLVDTREEREYDGETPYGETRGGHLPGAVHVYFKALLDAQGELKPREELLAELAALGVTPDKRVVAYCTGGIRSAWLIVVLKELGFERAQNYAGSMWEWAAQPASTYPLERE